MRSPLTKLVAVLGVMLALGAAPSFAQAPPPVPALPDSARQTQYSITASTCACSVGFALYGDGTDFGNWLQVYLNGVQVSSSDATFGWTITSATGSLGSIPRPITDAVLTFNSNQTGTVVIVSAQRPRRTAQFADNRGVAGRDMNQLANSIMAIERELWDLRARLLIGQPGNSYGPLPSPGGCANMVLGLGSDGLTPTCVTTGGGGGFSGYVPPCAPQGRLTLVSNTPVMASDQAAATTIYYTPAVGQCDPLYNGTAFVSTNPGGELSQALSDTTKSPAAAAANSCYDMFRWSDGGVQRISRGPAWSNAGNPCAGGRGTGAGTSQLTFINNTASQGGFYVNTVAITNGPAAQRGTYVGTIITNAGALVDQKFGTLAVGGGTACACVWNAYNQVPGAFNVADSTASFATSSVSWQPAFGNSGNNIKFVVGLSTVGYLARHSGQVSPPAVAGANASLGVSLDNSAPAGQPNCRIFRTTETNIGPSYVQSTGCDFPPATPGFHAIYAVIKSDGVNTNTFVGNTPSSSFLSGTLWW